MGLHFTVGARSSANMQSSSEGKKNIPFFDSHFALALTEFTPCTM